MQAEGRKFVGFKLLLNYLFIGLAILFLLLLFFFKGNMNELVSKKMKEQVGAEVKQTIQQVVDSAYNYTLNKEEFSLTFLEFGATGCIACRRMEKVMEEVRQRYPTKVKVEFLNVLLTENHDLVKYYGISAIPTQVLLDRTGKEVFRHTGFFTFAELNREFQKINF